MSNESFRSRFLACRTTLSVLAAGIVIFAAGCGGTMTSGTNPVSGNPASQTTTQIKIGDDPADRVLSLEVTVGPVTLTPDTGSPVTVLSGSQHIELAHLSATSEPISLMKIPQGSYKALTFSFANPEVTFVNSSGAVKKFELPISQTITVNFSPSISIGASSAVVSIDVNLSKLLTFDANGNVTGINFTADAFTISSADVGKDKEKENDGDGELEDTTGTITAINGSSFTLTVSETGVPLIFTTDANTRFEDGASLTMNAMVTVEGTTLADGTLYAKKIEGVEDENGAEAEGLITTVTGMPATALTIVADQGMGSGMDDTKIGATLTADVSNAKFQVKSGDVDTSGIGNLPNAEFPFDASTVHAGQRVELETKDAMNTANAGAEKVRLQQQALVGTVSGLGAPTSSGPATFTLTVASDSAFAMLSGQTQVSISWQPGTDLKNLSAVNDGDKIRVRGLVFFDGTAFKMIARRITK
jgi:hypothetical protein